MHILRWKKLYIIWDAIWSETFRDVGQAVPEHNINWNSILFCLKSLSTKNYKMWGQSYKNWHLPVIIKCIPDDWMRGWNHQLVDNCIDYVSGFLPCLLKGHIGKESILRKIPAHNWPAGRSGVVTLRIIKTGEREGLAVLISGEHLQSR